MLEKIAVMALIYLALFIFEVPKLKKQPRAAVLAYASILLFTIYLSLIYILDLKWPILHDAIEALLKKPAQHIYEFLNVTP